MSDEPNSAGQGGDEVDQGPSEVTLGVDPEKITTSTRDPEVMTGQFGAWLASVLPADAESGVVTLTSPQGNGMSSETLLVTARWTERGVRDEHRLVARVAPPETAYPVFPSYDLAMQHHVMGLVAQETDVPVPANQVMAREIQFLGSFRYGNVFGEAIRLVATGRLNLAPLISQVFPLAELPQAMLRAAAKESVMKVQVAIG